MERKVHAWRIEEREYARHESRRRRRHAYGSLTAASTALVVVDMVPFYVRENEYTYGIVPNIVRLAAAVRAAGGTVAWVLPGFAEPSPTDVEFFGPEVAARYARTGDEGLWHEFDVDGADLVVEKTARSAFFPGRCPLPGMLSQRGVDTVVITGTLTNVCCESSARDASTLGYRVVLVADANSANRDQDHNAALHTIYRSFGDVRTTDEVVDLLEA
ncbi:isochorismatase family cysteine hydrolase [Asanoa sp. NPDC049518]|uniref:isochorismatase family cysteine hydrolase n=1 Tax=unclassified Asanoa TaxID=2685164 RepID=UPI003447BB7B